MLNKEMKELVRRYYELDDVFREEVRRREVAEQALGEKERGHMKMVFFLCVH